MDNKSDIESNFFVIDSENLGLVHTDLYGYCVASCKDFYFDDETVNEKLLSTLNFYNYSDGAYVLVQSTDKEVIISQDFNGCFGLYLYHADNYFAISNSFVMLSAFLSDKVKVSLDYDYIKTYFLSGLTATAYSETMIKEICCLPKNVQVVIDKATKTIRARLINFHENTVSIDSVEGLKILDNWFYKWINIIRYLKSKTNKINVDLSGGMDSRIVFLLFVKSGIDLNEINIRSIHDNLHTHKDDYEIASQIAEYYQCQLNVSHSENKRTIPLSLEEFINLTSYVRLCFCTELYYKNECHEKPLYAFCGNGGEALRKHWNVTPKQFIKDMNRRAGVYRDVNFSGSVSRILEHAFEIVREKYHIADEKSPEIIDGFYRETRCRNHFGKAMAENSVCNVNTMAPLMDSMLSKIFLKGSKTDNKDIIIAVMFERYCPELLNFRFDSGRSIDSKILSYAKDINAKYPFVQQDQWATGCPLLQTKRSHKALVPKAVTNQQVKSFINQCFLSEKTYELFTKHFDKSIYLYAKEYSENHVYHPEARIIPVMGTVKIINDLTLKDKSLKPQKPSRFFYWLSGILSAKEQLVDDIFRTARIDIKNFNDHNNNNDMKITLEKNNSVVINKPAWFHNKGIGYSILACGDRELDFSAICLDKGEFTLFLRSRDIRDKQKKRINVFVDYKKLIVNGKEIIKRSTPVSHDSFYVYKVLAEKGDCFNIHVEWERHLYSKEEYIAIIESQLPDET